MGTLSKSFGLLLIILLLPVSTQSLLMIEPANAQSTLTPSPPRFTVRFVNASYSVTNANPYTGAQETQLINNNTIEVAIDSQSWKYSDNQIYYNIRARPHFAGNWTEIYPLRNLTSSYNNGVFTFAEYISPDAPIMPNSGPIVISFPVVTTQYYGESGYDVERYYSGYDGQQGEFSAFLHGIPYGSQLDFQVEAQVGYNFTYWYVMHPLYPQFGGFDEPATAYRETSSWSNTQTVSISANSATSSPTATPAIPEFTLLVVVPLLLSMFSVAAIVRRRKQLKKV